jgi:hypothetical protein
MLDQPQIVERESLRVLLYLFARDSAVQYLRSG